MDCKLFAVIDVCIIPHLYNQDQEQYRNTRIIMDRIESGKIKICYGGTTYKKQFSKMQRYHDIFLEYYRSGILSYIEDNIVDNREVELMKVIKDTDFDDHHIIAILDVSGGKILLTIDKRAMPYIKDRKNYSNGKVPIILPSNTVSRKAIDKIIKTHSDNKARKK